MLILSLSPKYSSVLEYKIPVFNEENQPDQWPDLLNARSFAMDVTNKKFQDLLPNEKAFFNHIKNNIKHYDIVFTEKLDGSIGANIGSFDRHLIQNRAYLWFPFILFSLVSNYSKFIYFDQTSLDSSILNGLVFFIGIFGISTTQHWSGFLRKLFYIWYIPLLIVAIVVSIFACFIA